MQEKCEQFEMKIRIAIVCYFCFYIIILVQILVDLVRDQLKTVQRDNRRRNPTGSHEMHQRRYQPGRSRWAKCYDKMYEDEPMLDKMYEDMDITYI